MTSTSHEPLYKVGEVILVEQGERLHKAKVLELGDGTTEGEDVKVHYLGWSKKWDCWAPIKDTRKITPESTAEQGELEEKFKQKHQKKQKKRESTGEERPSKGVQSASEAAASEIADSIASMKASLAEDESEASSSLVPPLPSGLRRRLVLDWEWLTRKQQILRLPARLPVVTLLAAFVYDHKQADEYAGTAEPSSAKHEAVLQVCEGLMAYFERCLPAVLLYRIERPQMQQFAEQHKLNVPAAGQSDAPPPPPLFSIKHMKNTLPPPPAAHTSSASSSSSSSAPSASAPPSALAHWLPDPFADADSFATVVPQWSGLYGVEHLIRMLCKLPAIMRDREVDWLPEQRDAVKDTLTALYRWLSVHDDLIYSYSAHQQPTQEYMFKLQQPHHIAAYNDEQQPSSGNEKSQSKRKVN